ncbi:hypothetical protein QBC46DRAFT_249660 [Diplogelasinospora grovesii]|uniref:Uncharacterized protein n=1 Tax=Diplogelasinospora grovesii TaxID=303347 RepID=A0AAN6NL95_9PEZI|nr:hypothetical protein QBC46DRAFT_249660 [Diplogelasinospora grovesii]
MPDLNSVPPSPHVLATVSRRTSSHQMPPPPVPGSPSLHILPSNQSAVNSAGPSTTSLPSPNFVPLTATSSMITDNSGVGPGPGPLRHPRPLTAADLHLQLEKEQEAVVNRLTREITLLRAAQNASVVSNASSTSASASETQVGDPSQHVISAPGLSQHREHRGSATRHTRTLSNTSNRSITANAGSISTTSLAGGISSPAPVRPSQPLGGISLSRQNSAASRRSRTGSPAPAPGSYPPHYTPTLPNYSQSQSQTPSGPHNYSSSYSHLNELPGYFAQPTGITSVPAATPGSSELSPGILPATTRYEETAFYRNELENVKKENEALKRRVRELERMVRDRRASDASRASQGGGGAPITGGGTGRTRSESVSTTASARSVAASTSGAVAGGGVSITAPREGREEPRPRVVSMLSLSGSVGVGVPEDEVRVGESAASSGLNREGQTPN